MKRDYIDRSMMVIEEFEDEAVRIEALKIQTRMAIEEATAKNLVSQTKLRKALENAERNSAEYKNIDETLSELRTNWEELNQLYRETSWMEALLWDEDY
jgi:regulator of replication initiation timing